MTGKNEIAEIDYSEFNNAGNEHLGSEDYQLPYLKILEKTSPTLDELEDAKAGELYLSATENSVEELYFIPLHYITVWSVWSEESPDKLLATCKDREEAKSFIEQIDEKATMIETGQNILLMLSENLEVEYPVMMYLSKSKLVTNKAFNTKMKIKYPTNAPRFAGVWKLGTKKRKNDKGSWFVPKFEFHSLCNKKLLDYASEMYKDITANILETTYRVY